MLEPTIYGDPMFAGTLEGAPPPGVMTLGGTMAPAPAQAAPMAPMVQNGGGAYPLAAVSGEGLMMPWTSAFQAPTEAEAGASPGFRFRLDEAMKAIERGGAANGTLLTGRHGKELMRYGQDYASAEYDKVYNRKAGEYQQAYNIFQNNQANAFNRLSAVAGTGQTAATNLGSMGQSSANAQSDLITGGANASAAGRIGSANAWGGAVGNIANGAQDMYMADIFRPRA
jgi:hypothetical protein